MSASDIALLVGQLVASWSVGFAAGYSLTIFKRGMDATV